MSREYDDMDFFELLDCCEQYNGDSTPFIRCRTLHRRLLEENSRMSDWLAMIDGGDFPCDDAKELREMAFAALQGKKTEDW